MQEEVQQVQVRCSAKPEAKTFGLQSNFFPALAGRNSVLTGTWHERSNEAPPASLKGPPQQRLHGAHPQGLSQRDSRGSTARPNPQ